MLASVVGQGVDREHQTLARGTASTMLAPHRSKGYSWGTRSPAGNGGGTPDVTPPRIGRGHRSRHATTSAMNGVVAAASRRVGGVGDDQRE